MNKELWIEATRAKLNEVYEGEERLSDDGYSYEEGCDFYRYAFGEVRGLMEKALVLLGEKYPDAD